MTPNPNAPVQQPGWFSRNWKWLVPVGCLVPLMCCGVFGVGAYFTASKMIEGSPAFAEAFSRASQNPEVTAALGAPLTPGFGMSGEIKETNGSGTANFSVPLNGPKGSGSLHVEARRSAGQWNFQAITVEAGGKTIDVLGAQEKAEPMPDEPEPGDEEAAPEEPQE